MFTGILVEGLFGTFSTNILSIPNLISSTIYSLVINTTNLYILVTPVISIISRISLIYNISNSNNKISISIVTSLVSNIKSIISKYSHLGNYYSISLGSIFLSSGYLNCLLIAYIITRYLFLSGTILTLIDNHTLRTLLTAPLQSMYSSIVPISKGLSIIKVSMSSSNCNGYINVV